MKYKSKLASVLLVGASLTMPGIAYADGHGSNTLEQVLARGVLKCGVDGGLRGFSAPDDSGKMQGLDADTCRVVAAVVLGDSDRVEFVPLTAKERFSSLSSGEIDMLSRNTTHTMTRDSTLGINFTYYNFIDGQGFLVNKSLGVNSATELDGARVCIQAGTTTELNLADYFRSNNMSFVPKGYDTSVQTREGYEGGACDVLTSDKSQLAAIRSELQDPSGSVILPETISKEPLGPVVRQGDDVWFNIVKWALYAIINAEEMGITSANADSMRNSNDPSIKRLMGTEGELCKGIAGPLSQGCFHQAIKQVGNYGEIYERHVGENSPLGLTRAGSVNDLWSRGGILYAPPAR